MVSHDTISDILIRIKNGQAASLLSVTVPNSHISLAILNSLHDAGYIRGYKFLKESNEIDVLLGYSNNEPLIRDLKIISKPGHRVYWRYRRIRRASNTEKKTTFLLSTSRGVITTEKACLYKIGGLIICKIN
uniref:Ribosomal protein S8 n=1 Tax=Eukaryota sp. BB2 TaxID=1949062 RepID=A0A1W5QHB4_9EUKA|nr:ribosomal protein S8 [Eukaryota sp. BB2]AQL10434.1 ribosomal protein S8 [Eukaryota sp. BB2]